jgi:hypothetical protein
MKNLLYILLFLPLFGSAQHWTDTMTVKDFNVEKSDMAKWTCMSKGGCYASNGEWIQYASIGYQFEIFTERANHHGRYKVEVFNVLGVENYDWILSEPIIIDTVNCNKPTFIKNYRTWVREFKTQRNRAIKITAIDSKPIVIDKIKVWVSSDPFYKPVYQDSLVIVEKDSIVWNVIEKDTIIWNTIERDSIVWNIEYKDTIIYHEKDTIIWTPICPPIDDCSDDCKIPIWVWVIIGSLVVTIILIIVIIRKIKDPINF